MEENQEGRSQEASEEVESNLIKKIEGTADDISLQDTVILWGYLKSLDDKYWRLYLTPTFNEYVDIRKVGDGKGDYVHHIHETGSPLKGTYVWVKRSARLPHTVVRSANDVADFLNGDITLGYLPEADPQGTLDIMERGGEGQRRTRPGANISRDRRFGCGSVCGGSCHSFAGPSCGEMPFPTGVGPGRNF
jgi:hypothetical protein